MRKLFSLLIAIMLAIAAGCSKNGDNNTIAVESTEGIDSLQTVYSQIDSLTAKGNLIHLESYEIGKIKSVFVLVNKIQTDKDTVSMVVFRKDCGGEYYYSWEEAILLKQEIVPFLNAIEEIRDSSTGSTDHRQVYAYVTYGDIRFSSLGLPNGWSFEFCVDINKSHSTISLTKNDIENLIKLVEAADNKIKEIEN